MNPRILLIVDLTARPGHDEAVLATLRELEAASRTEDGCLQYTMLRSLSDPGRFVVYEIWQSAEHLERHRKTAHYLAFGPIVEAHFVGAPARLELALPD